MNTTQTAVPITDRFDIPEAVMEKYPDLVNLIVETKSMDDKERQYWFHILPVMNEEQVDKLKVILDNEKQKLAEIDQKYSNTDEKPEVAALAENSIKDKMAMIQESEAADKQSEAAREAELLEQLQSI